MPDTEPPLTDDLGDVERLCTLGTRLARLSIEELGGRVACEGEPLTEIETTAREILRVAARLVARLKGE